MINYDTKKLLITPFHNNYCYINGIFKPDQYMHKFCQDWLNEFKEFEDVPDRFENNIREILFKISVSTKKYKREIRNSF